MNSRRDITHSVSPGMAELRAGEMVTNFNTRAHFIGNPVLMVDLSIIKKEFEKLQARIKELQTPPSRDYIESGGWRR